MTPTPTYIYQQLTCRPTGQRGISLVELMVSLFLGLVLLGAVMAMYLSNQQVFRQAENLARLQENARMAFELMGRDLREAGGIACGSQLPVANVVQGGAWWTEFGAGIQGFGANTAMPARAFGSGAADRVAGTQAIVIWSATTDVPVRVLSHDPLSAQFQVQTLAHGFVNGDIVMACDMRQAAIAQVSDANAISTNVAHNTGASINPGNCRNTLGLSSAPPHNCSTVGSSHTFAGGGWLSKMQAYAWYVGHNGRGGQSLYRIRLQSQVSGSTATATPTAEEMVENVRGLAFFYLEFDPAAGALASQYVDPGAVNDWSQVRAVRIHPVFETADAVGTDGNPIDLTMPFVVGLRNRLE